MPLATPFMPLCAGGAHTADIFVLRDQLHALFAHYGEVVRLDLVRADQGAVQRVLCFLRMGSSEQEQALVDALGMGRFGGDLVLVITLGDEAGLPSDVPTPTTTSAQAAPYERWR